MRLDLFANGKGQNFFLSGVLTLSGHQIVIRPDTRLAAWLSG